MKVPTGPNVDALLPPGSTGGAPLPGDATSLPLPAGGQVALPTEADAAAPTPLTGVPASGDAVMIPTEDGGVVAVRDQGKVIEHDGEEIELRKLTPEEKARKRMIKNTIMAAIGILFLAGVAMLLVMLNG